MKNGTIHDLIAYANQKGVGLLLWYNSGGPHNFVSEKPRGLMFHREVRRGEFALLKKWGIRGVKVDFFQSDKQDIMALYQDILEDAAEAGIMVNFHGCTLPRGWSRTYPHLMSMESMRGEECYSFDSRFPEEAPSHNATLPFTRNVVGPMDYTPVMFQDNVHPKRTTHVHELALPIVFECGWLHFADGVGPYRALPQVPKDILKRIPVAWDETRCLVGEPGRVAVIARRSGHLWYVGGIQATAEELSLTVDSNFLGTGAYSALVIEDGTDGRSFRWRRETLRPGDPWTLTLRPYGGFVIQLAPSL